MNKILLSLILWVFSLSLPIFARDILKIHYVNVDARSDQYDVIPVDLAFNSGVTINFSPSQEKITQVVADNISFFTIISNGCLSGLDSKKSCEAPGATMIHLRRIPDLKLMGMLPTNQSLLKIITQSSNGSSKIYLFNIIKSKTPKALVHEFVMPK